MLARATPAELARIPRIRAEFRPGRSFACPSANLRAPSRRGLHLRSVRRRPAAVSPRGERLRSRRGCWHCCADRAGPPSPLSRAVRAERLLKIPAEPSPELRIPGAAAQTRVTEARELHNTLADSNRFDATPRSSEVSVH